LEHTIEEESECRLEFPGQEALEHPSRKPLGIAPNQDAPGVVDAPDGAIGSQDEVRHLQRIEVFGVLFQP
jgi:hypothetical protein